MGALYPEFTMVFFSFSFPQNRRSNSAVIDFPLFHIPFVFYTGRFTRIETIEATFSSPFQIKL